MKKNHKSSLTCYRFFHDVKGRLTRPDMIRMGPRLVTFFFPLFAYHTGAKYDRIDLTPDKALAFALLILSLSMGPFTVNQFRVIQVGRRICSCSSLSNNS